MTKEQFTKMHRFEQLLILICERSSDRGETWYPSEHEEYVSAIQAYTAIGGAGDMSALNALVRRGLIYENTNIRSWGATSQGHTWAGNLLSKNEEVTP